VVEGSVTRTQRTERRSAAPPARRLALAAAMCLILGGLAGVLVATVQTPAPAVVRFIPVREPAGDFRLRDQNGRWTTLAQARGTVVVLTFVYSTCRDLCPAEGTDIADAIQKVGVRGVSAYFVSVDPVGDTPPRVQAWMQRRGLTGAGDHFVIGPRPALEPVWHHYGIVPIGATGKEAATAAAFADQFRAKNAGAKPKPFVYTRPPQSATAEPAADEPYPDTNDLRYRGETRHAAGYDFEHTAYVMLIDKHGEQRLGIPFEELSPGSLARDMRVLMAEA
jgi:protein SCO1